MIVYDNQITLRVDKNLNKTLDKIAKELKIKKSFLIRKMLYTHINTYKYQ